MRARHKRIFAWAMVILMTASFLLPGLALFTRADDDFDEEKQQIQTLSDKYRELQKKQDQVQAQLKKAKSEKDKQLAIKQQVENQIEMTLEQIDILEERIGLLEKKLEEKQEEIRAKQADIDEKFALFCKRLRAMYMSSSGTSTLGLVLGAEDYAQFLMRAEVLGRVADHDQRLIDELLLEKQELEEMKRGFEADKAELEQDKTQQAGKKQELDVQRQQAQKQIQDIAAMEREFLANKEELQKQMKEVQATIDAIYAEINKNASNIPYVGGRMGWPVPSLSQITSGYGYRFGGTNNHTGIDISGAGAMGAAIVAANTGTVVFVQSTYTPGYGYGKYLIIDHGGGISTLYGHCSAIHVSVGDTVVRGEKIASVGNTGWSTGPHLHFEVREGGKPKNPISYLSK